MEIQTSLFRENAISILKKKIIKSTTHVHLSTDEAQMIYEVLACECKCKELNLTNTKIAELLDISERTIYRYLDAYINNK